MAIYRHLRPAGGLDYFQVADHSSKIAHSVFP